MIEQLLKQLSKNDMKQLLIAFNQEIAQYIILDDDIFIGVHVEPLSNLEILERSGYWACGRIK